MRFANLQLAIAASKSCSLLAWAVLDLCSETSLFKQAHDLRPCQGIEMQIEADDRR
jgi:hypothetical protein